MFHRLMLQIKDTWGGWDIIKVHAITHYKKDIIRSGSTFQYSAEKYENLHQKVSFAVKFLEQCFKFNSKLRCAKGHIEEETKELRQQSHICTKNMRENCLYLFWQNSSHPQ